MISKFIRRIQLWWNPPPPDWRHIFRQGQSRD